MPAASYSSVQRAANPSPARAPGRIMFRWAIGESGVDALPRRATMKEKTMKSKKVSLRRRQLVIAGLAGSAASALAGQFRGSGAAVGELDAVEADRGLVISGRVLARNGRPLAGAAVEVWRA